MGLQKQTIGILCAGILGACSGSNTGNMNIEDMAMQTMMDLRKPADMAQTSMDMTGQVPDMVMPPTTFNGCTAASFVDRTAGGASRQVDFAVGGNFTYSPACILIAAGQSVTFVGSSTTFSSHPLRPGVGSNATAGSPNNPITATASGTSATFTFPTAGQYPYNCQFHNGSGMNGVVKVQ